jgi:acetate kinase
MKILVINCGSSSIKYQIYDIELRKVIEKGIVAFIGGRNSCLNRTVYGKEVSRTYPVLTHKDGFELIFRTLIDPKEGILKDLSEISTVGHRIAYGGTQCTQSTIITDEILKQIEKCIPFAPLHNPQNLLGIQIIKEILPNTTQVAIFDTCFHQTLPLKARVFPIPYQYYEKYGIQKLGYQSQSYRFVIPRAARLAGQSVDELKMVVCHLGGGCTITAIDKGKSVDTNLGFSTFAGVMMGTRSGDFDPGLIFYLNREFGMSLDEIENMLYRESGLLGISGVSSDMVEVLDSAARGNERCQLAVEMFTDRVKKTIGAFAVSLGKLDLLVFTAGIGENSPELRERVCLGLECLGIELDQERNLESVGKEAIISSEKSKIKVMVVPTNEEQIMIEDTIKVAGLVETENASLQNNLH